MIYKEPFELNAQEIEMIEIARNKLLETNWTKEGVAQEQGAHAEILICRLLKLCDFPNYKYSLYFDSAMLLEQGKASYELETFSIETVVKLVKGFLNTKYQDSNKFANSLTRFHNFK